MILSGIAYDSNIFHRVSLCTLSNAFLKSTKLMCRGAFHSRHCSMMFFSAKIWSMHPLPLRKPACSCLSLLSMAESNRRRRTLQNILLGVERRVIPRQLSQFCRLPFLGILTMRPFVQSHEMVLVSHIWLKRSTNTVVEISRSACNKLM